MKKSNCYGLLLTLGLVFIVISCSSSSSSPHPEPEPQPPVNTIGPVAADGVLEAVTWNLEWFGSPQNGPSNETRQLRNVLTVMDSLNADLYALQEISTQHRLNELTAKMKGYRGFVANYVDYNQRMAFVFNTQTIDSISSGAITKGQDHHAWASGRFPLYFSFQYRYKGETIPIYAIVIHAKAFDDRESYQRRQEAALDLYTYLTNQKPNAHIILLGDYNDDVDESIYQQKSSPYAPFVTHDQQFLVITKVLSLNEQSSTTGYPDPVDHITISNELVPYYIQKSAKIFAPGSFIENYGATTSGHYPVWAQFDFR